MTVPLPKGEGGAKHLVRGAIILPFTLTRLIISTVGDDALIPVTTFASIVAPLPANPRFH